MSIEFYKNNTSAIIEMRKFSNHHFCDLIRKLVHKFDESGSTMEKPKSERPRSSINEGNVESVRHNPFAKLLTFLFVNANCFECENFLIEVSLFWDTL